jgi:hypothetical protein
MKAEDCCRKLLENGLFQTLLISKIAKESEEKYESITEREIIGKLERMGKIERQ